MKGIMCNTNSIVVFKGNSVYKKKSRIAKLEKCNVIPQNAAQSIRLPII